VSPFGVRPGRDEEDVRLDLLDAAVATPGRDGDRRVVHGDADGVPLQAQVDPLGQQGGVSLGDGVVLTAEHPSERPIMVTWDPNAENTWANSAPM
jgi:hypothetical protein